MKADDRMVADAPPRNLVDRFAPVSWRPWLRLGRFDRPIGSWLLMWPCQWSAALAAIAASSTAQLPAHIGLFLIGAFVMRGAGSTWNDFLDRDIDGRVERTRDRPIPAGQVSAKQALAFAVAQSLVGLVVLFQFNRFTILLGILSLVPVAVYPLMKRVMGYPQAVLGLCFAWGAFMGFGAVFGSLPWPAFVLYVGSIAWVIGYDTIYGHQDQRDDAVIGVKSTSRTFGRWSRAIIAALYAATVVLVGIAIWGCGGGWPSFAGLAASAAHLAWQARRLDPDRPDVCLMLFRSNRDAGALLFAGLLADALMR
jgi:4-hydroxybenzoate polyprenyltransferase